MAQFNPNDESVDEVLSYLEKADPAEQQRVLNLERGGKKRKTVLEEYGIDPNSRVDASGRELYPWEVDPEDHVYQVQEEETPKQKAFREAQAKQDEQIAAASAAQGASTPAGSGTADAGVADGAAAASTTAGSTAGTSSTSGGAGL